MGIQNTDPKDFPTFLEEKLENFVSDKIENGMFFDIPMMKVSEVKDMIQKLNPRKARGMDNVDVKFLQLSCDNIAVPLTVIFNLSIKTHIFPNDWKLAKVTALYKDGIVSDANNYRPISVLSVLSKIIEKHVHSNFYDFLMKQISICMSVWFPKVSLM